MMVPFATTCDIMPASVVCGARSLEYAPWPRCRECDRHCCDVHQAPGTLIDADLDAPATCLCVDCEADT